MILVSSANAINTVYSRYLSHKCMVLIVWIFGCRWLILYEFYTLFHILVYKPDFFLFNFYSDKMTCYNAVLLPNSRLSEDDMRKMLRILIN